LKNKELLDFDLTAILNWV